MEHGAAEAERDPRLDGLRGFAVLLVLLFHTTLFGADRTFVATTISALPSLGWCGVDLFFVLSGFLITRILLVTRDSSSYYRAFWARRALRIAPLYYAMLVFFLLVAPRVPALAEWNRLWTAGVDADGLWYWLYLSNWKVAFAGWDSQSLSVLWSLAIEEQFYLFWPFVVRRLDDRRLLFACAALVVAAPLLRMAVHLADVSPLAAYVATPCRLDPLAAGAAIAVIARRRGDLASFAGPARRLCFLALWTFVTMALYLRSQSLLRTVDTATQNMNPWVQVVGFSLLAVGGGALLVATLTAPAGSALARCFELRALRELGRVSYAIYLFHVAIWNTIKPTLLPVILAWPYPLAQLAAWATVLALAYALALASWTLLESRALAWKRHFPYRV